MSKKLFSEEKWKSHLRRRQERQLARAQRPGKAGERYFARPVRQKREYVTVRAPDLFSIRNSPDEFMDFLGTMELYSERYHIALDLAQVKEVTTEAIAAMMVTLKQIGKTTHIRGSSPVDPGVREIFLRSGFFEHVSSVQPLPEVTHGKMSQKKSRKVEPKIAQDLIRIATKAVHGTPRKCKAAYRVLIESMSNTNNHAARRSKKDRGPVEPETWWSTVYADEKTKITSYTFVDNGVGIFRSLKFKTVFKFYRAIQIKDHSDVLRDILDGKVASRTGFPYRGKGLPAINKLARDGRIKGLIIVTNDVYANVSRGEFKLLKRPFKGTLLSWEI